MTINANQKHILTAALIVFAGVMAIKYVSSTQDARRLEDAKKKELDAKSTNTTAPISGPTIVKIDQPILDEQIRSAPVDSDAKILNGTMIDV